MSKVKIDTNAFTYPMPMTLVGAMVGETPNFLAVAWVTRVNYKPPMMAVALGKAHHTNPGIRATQAFSVNVPGVDLLEKTDYCGLVSGKKADKSRLFTVFRGEITGAPMIGECRLCMECRVVQVVDLEADELFIGEIVGAYADEGCLGDQRWFDALLSEWRLNAEAWPGPNRRKWSGLSGHNSRRQSPRCWRHNCLS